MIKNKRLLFLIAVFCQIFIIQLFAEDSFIYSKFTGTSEKSLDTLALETAQKNIKESIGILEKEVNPNQYLVGPNDIFSLLIISSKPRSIELTVSPEGKIVIPGVGMVNVKGKTLAQTDSIIIERVKQIYKTEEIYVTLKELRKFKVTISGSVRKPSIIEASAAERVSELIIKSGGFLENSSLRHIKLIRDSQIINVDVLKFYLAGDKESNPFVNGGDLIIVPNMDKENQIEIAGEVGKSGSYEYVHGDSLSTLVRFGNGFTAFALLDSIEIIRKDPRAEPKRKVINLESWRFSYLNNTQLPNDFPLEPNDRVFIRINSEMKSIDKVCIKGEVKYPGYYALYKKDERINSLIERAGGFTESASIENIIFLRQNEYKKIDMEMDRLWRTPQIERSVSEQQYFTARISERRGVLSVNFKKLIKEPNSVENIVLYDKDSIFVPLKNEFINVQGRVNSPGLITFRSNLTYQDYINLAGGYGYRADKGSVLVVKSKGQQFLASNKDYILEPGDNILVPSEREDTFETITKYATFGSQIVTFLYVIYTMVKLR
ncbi:MAG: SLBB domain-containing protein [Candidatus Kapabacteria bacterium]|nr:SLBB domain-containing protein [Candidatus Kapabacteria bacterium]